MFAIVRPRSSVRTLLAVLLFAVGCNTDRAAAPVFDPSVAENVSAPLPGGHQWPGFKGRANRNGRTPLMGPASSQIAWTNSAIEINGSSPVIARDGTIYVGSWDGLLYAVRRDGTTKWAFPLGNVVTATPAIASDGTVYVAPEDGDLYAIASDGTLQWTFDLEGYGGPSASPVVAPDGTIYVAADYFYAINPDGTSRWRYDAGVASAGPPAIAADGTVYFPAQLDRLFALDAAGTLEWVYNGRSAYGLGSAPAIAGDGTIYLNSAIGTLRALRPDGTLKWQYRTEGIVVDVPSSPVIGASGTVYFGGGGEYGGHGGYLYAVAPNGALRWRFYAGCDQSTPTVDGSETIYFGNNCGGTLYAVDSNGSLEWSYGWGVQYLRSAPAIGTGGRLYVGLMPWIIGSGGLVAVGP